MESLKDDALQETIGTDVADIEAIDMSSWAELRIHPLLLKALSALGFREPTPIQKACIPAAAHQGKVCALSHQHVCTLSSFLSCLCYP
jgi:ATP-dependent RNA helicase DDX24/MAK5